MSELPPTKSATSIFDYYGTFADSRDLAALIMIESQDSIFANFQDGIIDRIKNIESLNKARDALVIAIAYAQEAEAAAQEQGGGSLSEDRVVVVEAEDAETLYDGLTTEPEPSEDCDVNADNKSGHGQGESDIHPNPPIIPESTSPAELTAEEKKTEGITDDYEEGKDWRVTVGELRYLIDVLTQKVKILGAEISSMVDNVLQFLEESEDSIQKINIALRQTEIDPAWLDKLTINKPEHFEMKDFLRRIEETRQEEKIQQVNRKEP